MTALLDDPINQALLDRYQQAFPLDGRPFARIGEALGIEEAEVIERFAGLQAAGMISRIGAVLTPHRAGWSTLAAMAVPPARLDQVADLVSACPAVNHNYQRDHRINLWFVVTGEDRAHVAGILHDIGRRTGLEVLDLPMEQAFHIDLGFPLRWS